MIFQRLNRTDPEKVFIVVKNSYGTAAITVGVGVTRPTTALRSVCAGVVADASIAAGEYGLIQIYGHNADALVDGTTGLVAGNLLIPGNAVFNFVKTATGVWAGAMAGELYSTGAAVAKKVFLRLM